MKFFFVIILWVGGQTGYMNYVYSQPPRNGNKYHKEERREQIEVFKIGFITQKLNLTTEEAAAFFPLYKAMNEEIEKLRKEHIPMMRKLQGQILELSDKDAEMYADLALQFKAKELAIQQIYHQKFKTVLPIRKLALLYVAEMEFKKNLLDKIQQRN